MRLHLDKPLAPRHAIDSAVRMDGTTRLQHVGRKCSIEGRTVEDRDLFSGILKFRDIATRCDHKA